MKKICAVVLAAAWLSGCSDSDDPSVSGQSDLAPPTGLTSITGDTQIELRWTGANFESSFKGYNVFQATSSIAALKTSAAPASPLGVDIAKAQGVPRCAANNSFFKAFGITMATTSECDDVTSTATAAEDPAAVGVQKAKVMCLDPDKGTALGTEATTSLDVSATNMYANGQGTQRCLIKGLTNGTTYSFIVVAVTGDSFDAISWTSNVMEDTPATKVFSGTVTIPASKYATITLSSTAASAAATLADGTSATACSGSICKLTGTNDGTAASIYLARDNVGDYPQRVFASTGSGSTVKIAYRGPLTNDPVKGDSTVATSVPGDAAVSGLNGTGPYKAGEKFVVYDNQVYDIKYTLSGLDYYGKLVVDNLTYASASKSGDVTFTATLLMQSQAGQVHYLDGNGSAVSVGDDF